MRQKRSLRLFLGDCRERLFPAHAERRYARQASLQLLDLYQQQRREHPELTSRALYEGVLAKRLRPEAGCTPELLIRRAEESFTDWPVERELRFRHVVHYLIFDEYIHSGKGRKRHKNQQGIVVSHVISEEI